MQRPAACRHHAQPHPVRSGVPVRSSPNPSLSHLEQTVFHPPTTRPSPAVAPPQCDDPIASTRGATSSTPLCFIKHCNTCGAHSRFCSISRALSTAICTPAVSHKSTTSAPHRPSATRLATPSSTWRRLCAKVHSAFSHLMSSFIDGGMPGCRPIIGVATGCIYGRVDERGGAEGCFGDWRKMGTQQRALRISRRWCFARQAITGSGDAGPELLARPARYIEVVLLWRSDRVYSHQSRYDAR